jgi:ribose transport system ATP-binding protein
MPATGTQVPVVELAGLSKVFGGVHALHDVSLEILPGEVHALVGENGSGKSTLIKVLAGFHDPEPGAELRINGRSVPLPLGPRDFHAHGLSFVHQDLGLVPELTVLENLLVGNLAQGRSLRFVGWARARRQARTMFARFGLGLDPSSRVLDLSQTDRARLAIVRAVESLRRYREEHPDRRGLLVLDEPTVFLPREGVDQLFGLMREVADQHASVLFVTHDLDEVKAVADRVSVLRDGRVRATVSPGDASADDLVELIIGRRLAGFEATHHDLRGAPTSLVVSDLCGGAAEGVSFEASRGEVVGLTGLMGSGFDDVPYMLFGAQPASRGEIVHAGVRRDLRTLTPKRALAAGAALVPGDRQRLGGVGTLTVAENVSLPVLDRFKAAGLLADRRLRDESAALLRFYDVRPQDPRLPLEALSGGNQQKAVMAKWLQTEPRLLLVHEPTQGVDIGAREQIFKLLRASADRGMTVLCASSDYEQLAAICDRVLIFAGGRIVRQLAGEVITKDRIAEQVLNSGMPLAKGATES